MKYYLSLLLFALCFIELNAQAPDLIYMDGKKLLLLKKQIADKDPQVKDLLQTVIRKADKMLDMVPVSVMDKEITPVSGSKHDYMSQAPYFWYDSSKPNGLPYMRRDGDRNPEINKITDHEHLNQLENATSALSIAYYVTGEEKYAIKAIQLVRHWFLNDATKMNPNLDYGQGVPGVNNGRGIGIIETRSLIDIADDLILLKRSPTWTSADQIGMRAWYTTYLNWLLNSKNGKDERKALNNHGTWYSAQVVDFAIFIGDNALARQLAEEGKKRMDKQMDAEGKMALELERNTALGYCTFNLLAWSKLATIASNAGIDIWNYKNPSGAGLQKAVDWLMPYAMGEQKWTYQQIHEYKLGEFYELMLHVSTHYSDQKYIGAAFKTGEKGKDLLLDHLWSK